MKLLTILLLCFFSKGADISLLDVSEFERMAIQDGGRIKPFDTFSRETVQLITGTQTFHDKNPTETVLSWLFFPDHWMKMDFFQIKNLELKRDLQIPETQTYVSPDFLISHQRLPELFSKLMQHQAQKKKQNPYMTAVGRINNQLTAFRGVISGSSIKLLPQQIGNDWLSMQELKGEPQELFAKITQSYFPAITKKNILDFNNSIIGFKEFARKQNPGNYPSDSTIELEIKYNSMRPFQKAYVFYLIAAIFFCFALYFTTNPFLYWGAGLFLLGGFLIQTAGFIARIILSGRPPVSNMYESIIWVSLGCITFGIVFELMYRKKYVGLAAAVMGTLGLIVADSVPAVLDQSIRPLEPVLRSNYWLTVHVLTITLSYGAFALATGIGNIALFSFLTGKEFQHQSRIQNLSMLCYRALQIGVLLLTAGTILGGVWADYSWGRFWGWDPKETWALIADLAYLAVLHGRFSGWMRNFGFLASTVLCFSAVIMAWYGVNFVLGVGLHSYGFGGGGVQYVGAGVIIQLLYVILAALIHFKVLGTRANSSMV